MNKKDDLMYGYIKNRVNQIITQEQYKQLIGEGLIMTQNIDYVANLLKKYANKVLTVIVNSKNNTLGIIFKDKSKESVDRIITLLNNYGYFLSAYLNEDGDNLGVDVKDGDFFLLRLALMG